MTIDLTPAELREFARLSQSTHLDKKEHFRWAELSLAMFPSDLAIALADAMEERDALKSAVEFYEFCAEAPLMKTVMEERDRLRVDLEDSREELKTANRTLNVPQEERE